MDNSTTSAPGASLLPDGIAVLTTIHFALIAVLALFAVAVIVWGMRSRSRRRAADEQIAEHNEEVETSAAPEQPVVPPAEPSPAAPPPAAPPPVAPAPPPATDEIVAGTPAPDVPTPDASSPADGPVTQLKGLGPKVAARLAELGITTVGQLAALDPAAATALDAQLGTFAGRMTRDRWLDQARLLAAGDKPGFEAVFGKL